MVNSNNELYDLLDINEAVTGGRKGFVAYRVTGDSTLEVIKPGYLVFADPSCEPKTGDVIVSRINGKNCVRVFEQNNRALHLISANERCEPRQVNQTNDSQILGVAKGHLSIY